MHILIFGGSGFLGKRIAQYAHSAGHKVSIASRSTSLASPFPVHACDVYDPSTYSHLIDSADAVVHSIGTFFPSTAYKNLIGEPLTPCTALNLAKSHIQGGNPLVDGYTKVNTASADVLARATDKSASAANKIKAFVYISAEASKLTNPEYIESKRRAEQLIADNKHLRSVYLRPGILYDPKHRPSFPPSVRDIVSGTLAAWDVVTPAPRTSADTLAKAVVDACVDPEIKGVVPNEALRQYEALS